MGCFLACFGSSKDRKTRKQRYKVQPRFQRNASCNVQYTVSLERSNMETPISPVKEVRDDKAEEQLSSVPITRKKVTFDTNVKTYEHVVVNESTDFKLCDEEEEEKKGKEKEENLAKSRESETSSEHSSITSSSSSYPPNHRYQNCRESDDEVEHDELDYEESDLDDDDYEDFDDGAVESRDRVCGIGGVSKEADGLVEEQVKPIGLIRGARDRTGNVHLHPVLNPVENLTQWRAMKAKGATPFKLQKENLSLEKEEPRLSFSWESKSDHEPKKLNEEVSVAASLSNWLSSTETTPAKKSSSFDASSPERSMSQGLNSLSKSKSDHEPKKLNEEVLTGASLSNWLSSTQTTPVKNNSTFDASMSLGLNSPRSPEDRPILGALTLEEIKKFSASCSPRRSPSRSPDEMPIIGTVGTYWSHVSTTKNSGSATSFKGIPNTTSKYREDKKVNWHSTPFQTRLERALNKGSADAYSNQKIC